MIRYFFAIPAAALRREIDGNLYAHVAATVTGCGVVTCAARMVRADGAIVSNGVARVPIGAMGDKVAQTLALPWGVDFVRDYQ